MDSLAKTKRPKVFFIPMTGDENPYQRQLADHLEQPELGRSELEQAGDTTAAGDATAYEVIAVDPSVYLLRSVWRHGKPAVVHLHWLHLFVRSKNGWLSTVKVVALVSQLALMRLMGIRIVWTVHNLHDHEKLNPTLDRLVNKSVARLAHRLIVHGETAKRLVCEAYSLKNGGKVAVIPHGNYCQWYPNTNTRAEAREKLDLGETDFVFLLLGILRPYKGVTELIAAFQETVSHEQQASNTKLVIAGKPLTEDFGREIDAAVAGTENIVYHPGYVDSGAIQDYLNSCDVAVFPYRDILTSGAIVLAMSFGRACIACQQGGVNDVLDEERAFLYEPVDEQGLATCLKQAIERRADLPEIGQRNLSVAQDWSWRVVADLTRAVYQK